ncbi:hypothetical protein CH25_gp14 [Mycobacterium phage EagleEye]|uniref:Uncharacterized protein n=1 Tax=Mycobacterium phage EagleEye TaxID=1429759 RepID=W0LN45_9CAUD|nr:hypothetical protein CH25_gp14 [Mycobacterium phage EagleEye]AHG23872.1 hypothetical protein PBI_EAGLEEYE_92 [Mycobacterium phage EagleEye]QDK03525.1 hypothetical protein SEA_LUCYEDI_91 [Mycobacterium phage Lucyedi]QNJ55889.1 hypothetical protein SEA_PAINTERBOY_90 [Mycobacterium phage PainterBoy]
MSFARWLGEVDRFMLGTYGVTHGDIADWLWHDAYDAGQGPRSAAREAIEADGLFVA